MAISGYTAKRLIGEFYPVQPILSVEHLSKSFGNVAAVRDLSLDVFPGDIYGFLGQNGAGKSTTMRMMLGLIKPDNGSIRIKGVSFHQGSRKLLRYVGAIIERPDMYGYLSMIVATMQVQDKEIRALREELATTKSLCR